MGSGGGSGRCGCWGMLRSGKCKLQPRMHGKGRPARGFLAKIRGEGASGEWDTSEGDCLRDVGMSLQPQAFDFQLKQEASKKPPRRKRTLSASLNPATLASSELSFPLHTSGPPLRAPRSQIQATAPPQLTKVRGISHLAAPGAAALLPNNSAHPGLLQELTTLARPAQMRAHPHQDVPKHLGVGVCPLFCWDTPG